MAKRSTLVSTIPQVAKHFKVSPRTVATWLSQGCPGRPGRYDLAAVGRWRGKSPAKPRDESPHARLARLKGDREEIEIAQLHRDLIPREPAVRLVTRRIREACSRLEQIPDQVASVVASMKRAKPAEVRRQVQVVIAGVCRALSEVPEARELVSGDLGNEAADEAGGNEGNE